MHDMYGKVVSSRFATVDVNEVLKSARSSQSRSPEVNKTLSPQTGRSNETSPDDKAK